MKLTLLILALTAQLCSAYNLTNIYLGASVNDGTGDTLRTSLGKANTNFYYLTNLVTFTSNALYAANIATSNEVSMVFTNWVSGQLYTNLSGRLQFARGQAILTPAAVAGDVAMYIKSAAQGSALMTIGDQGFQTLLTVSLVASNVVECAGFIPSGNVFTFTNSSSGSGNTAIMQAGTGQQVTY